MSARLPLLQGWKAFLSVFIAGALLPLAFSPTHFYFLAVLVPAVFFYSLLDVTPRRGAWLGFSFGMGFFAVGISWVFVAIYVFGLSSFSVSLLLTVLFIMSLSLFFVLQAYLSVIFIHKAGLNNERFRSVLVFALFWVLLEWFRGWFLTGFPWLSLGYSQTDSLLAGYAPVLGVFGISLLVALSSALLLFAVLAYLEQQGRKLVTTVITLVVIWLGGALLLQFEWTDKAGKALKVSLVQGNVDQKTKWDPRHFKMRKQRYMTLTRQHWDSDLILWPENAMTVFYHELKNNFLAEVAREAKKNNSSIILGLPVLNLKTDQYYSALMTATEKPQFYFKTHLVPFGEYVPLASLLRGAIAFFDLPMSGFSPGSPEQDLFRLAGQKIAPTICYEDAFGEEVIRYLPEATIIMNASNNAWYGDSFAPHQHLQISRMRALETGREVMRVTTNGISALIDHKGRIKARAPQFKAAVVTDMVQPYQGSTPYIQFGNTPVLILLFTGFMLLFFYRKRLH